jgi:hypothetical protein
VTFNRLLEGQGQEVEEMNSYIKKWNEKFWKFLNVLVDVPDPAEYLQVCLSFFHFTLFTIVLQCLKSPSSFSGYDDNIFWNLLTDPC